MNKYKIAQLVILLIILIEMPAKAQVNEAQLIMLSSLPKKQDMLTF
jgi:hypothetical protein